MPYRAKPYRAKPYRPMTTPFIRSAAVLTAALLTTACAGLPAADHAATTPPAAATALTLPAVQTGDSYYALASARVTARAMRSPETPVAAKNVILFIGDGMGISTITAARIRAGERAGMEGPEAFTLAMDTLPFAALSRTYAHDGQVPDSAATATAMVSGVKTNMRTINVTADAVTGQCAGSKDAAVTSLFDIAEDQGLATGIVSTTRITHATPASAYGSTPMRDWEADSDLTDEARAQGCIDLARQLVDWPHGDGLEIALGGGRTKFLPSDMADPEYDDQTGGRADGADLTAEWAAKSPDHGYVWTKDQFEAVDFATEARILGLFEPSHMQFELDRDTDPAGEPSLADMTEAAITRLSGDEDGFLLMVEGGRIDHAHHGVNAARALDDTLAFDEAVARALEMTSADDTLVIVTADHSHVFTISGYPTRGNPILGLVRLGNGMVLPAADGMPFTTLSYANGPTAICEDEHGDHRHCPRADLSDVDTEAPDFRQPALVPLSSETHSGEDVAALASGPGAALVSGVIEQNELFHVMARSLGFID